MTIISIIFLLVQSRMIRALGWTNISSGIGTWPGARAIGGRVCVMLLAALLALPGFEAAAQQAPEPSAVALEQLIQNLENEQARADLIQQLRALLEARRAAGAVGGVTPPSFWEQAQAVGGTLFARVASDYGLGIVAAAARIMFILLVAFAAMRLAQAAVNRALRGTAGNGNKTSLRAQTLQPLIVTATRVAIGIIAGLAALSELGVDITPILAGASIFGIAIGFGAQKLVQDVITGLFILADDTIRVGEVASAGGETGLVEAVTLRTVKLRDMSGAVYTIPHSEIRSVKNLTRDFAYAVFEIGIDYAANSDAAVTVMRQVAEDLRADPVVGADILEPLEVLGVDSFADSAVIIKARIKTVPIKQWGVMRGFNRRLKIAFDANGIEFPFPQRTVHIVDHRAEGDASPASGAHQTLATP